MLSRLVSRLNAQWKAASTSLEATQGVHRRADAGPDQASVPFEAAHVPTTEGALSAYAAIGSCRRYGREAPGTLARADRLRWRLPGGRPALRNHLDALFDTGYHVLSPKLDEPLQSAKDALMAKVDGETGAFTWQGPGIVRNLTFGGGQKLRVIVSVDPMPDERHEVEAKVEPSLQAKVLSRLRDNAVAENRVFGVDWARGQHLDDLLATLAEWSNQITNPPEDEDAARLCVRRLAHDLRTMGRHVHRRAVLGLFDELWTPDRSRKRTAARADLERQVDGRAPVTGRSVLAAIMRVGARRQLKTIHARLEESADAPTFAFDGDAELRLRPGQQLDVAAVMRGQFVVEVPLDAPVRSDFLAHGAQVTARTVEGETLDQRDLDGATSALVDLWAAPVSARSDERPTYRLSVEAPSGETNAGVRPTQAQFQGDTRAFRQAFMAYQADQLRAEQRKHGMLTDDGTSGPHRDFLYDGMVYYGRHDDWRPEDVFIDGIPEKDRPEVFDLTRHQADDPGSGLRGSCITAETPAGFGGEGGYVYVLFPLGGAMNLQVLDHEKDSQQVRGAQGETEYAFGSMQPGEVIAGAIPIGARFNEATVRHRLGTFIPNPRLAPEFWARLPSLLRKHFPDAPPPSPDASKKDAAPTPMP